MQERQLSIPEGVYARSVKSGWWYGASIAVQKGLGLIGLLILIRLLQPEDYGAFAALVVVAGLFDQFTSIPFGHALIQRKGAVDGYMDPLWTWDLCRVAVVALLIAFFAGPLADYFEMTGIGRQLMPWAGLFLLIPALGNPRQVYFFRLLDMRRVFWRDFGAQAGYLAAALIYAFGVEASVAALFVGQIGRYVAGAIMSYVLYPARPRLSFAFGKLRDLLNFGGWIYGQNLVNYLAGTADRILVGGIMETERLGLYTRARDLSLTASSTVASGFDKIGMPAFARLQDEAVKLKAGIVKGLDLFVLTAVPFALIVLLEAGTAVPLILGEQWIAIVLPLKIFAVGSLAHALLSLLQPLFVGTGQPKKSFQLRLVQALIALPLLAAGGLLYGPVGLAVAITISWIVALLFGVWRARTIVRLQAADVWSTAIPALVAVVATFVVDLAGRGAVHAFSAWWSDLLWFGALGLVYVAALLAVSFRMGHGPFETVNTIMNQLTARLKRA